MARSGFGAGASGSQGWAETGWLAAVILLPLVVNPWGGQPFSIPKSALLKTLVWASAALWLVGALVETPGLFRRLSRNPLFVPSAVLAGVTAAATAVSPWPALALWGSEVRASGWITFVSLPLLALLVADGMAVRAARRRLFWAMLAPVPLVLALAGVQYLEWDPSGLVTDAASSIFATLGRSNFLAAYLAMLLPLTWTAIRLAPRSGLRFLVALCLVAQAASLVILRVRGAWMGALAAIVVLAVLGRWPAPREWLRRPLVAWSALGIFGAAIAGGLLLAQQGGSGAARLAIWTATARLVAARPFLGYGADTLEVAFARVFPPELVYYQGRNWVVDRAHNLALDWAFSFGVLGCLAGVAVLATILRAGIARVTRHGAEEPDGCIVRAYLAALIAYLTTNLVSFGVVPTDALAWAMGGAIVGHASSTANASSSDTGRAPGWAAVRWGAAGLVTLSVVAAIYWINLRPVLADTFSLRAASLRGAGDLHGAREAAGKAMRLWPYEPAYLARAAKIELHSALAAPEADAARVEGAELLMLEAVRRRPDDFRGWLELAGMYETIAWRVDRRRVDDGRIAHARAIDLAPNHAVMHAAAASYELRFGDLARAEPRFRKAVELDATDADSWQSLAEIAAERGDLPEALSLYRQVITLQPESAGAHAGLARTYWLLGQPEAAAESMGTALGLGFDGAAAGDLVRALGEGGYDVGSGGAVAD